MSPKVQDILIIVVHKFHEGNVTCELKVELKEIGMRKLNLKKTQNKQQDKHKK